MTDKTMGTGWAVAPIFMLAMPCILCAGGVSILQVLGGGGQKFYPNFINTL